jgi:CelD/BcsL family acetyltransferase involved in cellulose biosynthesis
MGLAVTVARGAAELERIVPEWEALARAALERNPFYEHWMLRPALEAYGVRADLRIVLVWSGNELAGLFPFERITRYKGLPVSALASWRHPHCLLCTPLVRADHARECLAALFDAIEAPLVEFRYLVAGEPFHRALAGGLAARGAQSVVNRSYERGLLRKHRATISARFRRQAARNERRLKGLAHVALAPHDDIGPWIDDFLRLEASGWKGRDGGAMACSETNGRYFREILTSAHARGRLLFCGLDVEGRAIARRCSFTAGEGAYAFKIAYDEEFAEFSPGALLELDNVRQVDADPRIQWMDAFTEANVLAVERLWPDRRTIETRVAGLGAWGRLAAGALPWLRRLKRGVPVNIPARIEPGGIIAGRPEEHSTLSGRT